MVASEVLIEFINSNWVSGVFAALVVWFVKMHFDKKEKAKKEEEAKKELIRQREEEERKNKEEQDRKGRKDFGDKVDSGMEKISSNLDITNKILIKIEKDLAVTSTKVDQHEKIIDEYGERINYLEKNNKKK